MFQSSISKPSLETSLVIPKERMVTLRLAGLAVSGCKGSEAQHTLFCREISFVASYAHMGEGGDSQKVTSDDEGEGGGSGYPPKMMTSFMNSP